MKNIWAVICTAIVCLYIFYPYIKNIGRPDLTDNKINIKIDGDTLTVYPIECGSWINNLPPQDKRKFENCLQPKAFSRIKLKIDLSNQQVTYYNMDDNDFPGFTKEIHCTVVDIKNWTCKDQYPFLQFGVINGHYFANSYDGILFASESQWNSINNGSPTMPVQPLGVQ